MSNFNSLNHIALSFSHVFSVIYIFFIFLKAGVCACPSEGPLVTASFWCWRWIYTQRRGFSGAHLSGLSFLWQGGISMQHPPSDLQDKSETCLCFPFIQLLIRAVYVGHPVCAIYCTVLDNLQGRKKVRQLLSLRVWSLLEQFIQTCASKGTWRHQDTGTKAGLGQMLGAQRVHYEFVARHRRGGDAWHGP